MSIYNARSNKDTVRYQWYYLLLNPKNEEALYMLIELEISKSNFSKVNELNEKFSSVCLLLCDKKNIITQQISNLQPESSKKE